MEHWEYIFVNLDFSSGQSEFWPPDSLSQELIRDILAPVVPLKGKLARIHKGWLVVDPIEASPSTKGSDQWVIAAAFLHYLGREGWEAVATGSTANTVLFKRPITNRAPTQ